MRRLAGHGTGRGRVGHDHYGGRGRGACSSRCCRGVGVIGANRILNREKVAGLDWYMTDCGIVLWVRVQSPEQEDAALKILSDHGAIAAAGP